MSTLQWDKAFAMEQAADDAELLQELLDIFKDSFHSDVGLIEQGIDDGDPSQVAAAAHSIKGAAASLGIKGIKIIAERIEKDSHGGSVAMAKSNMPLLHELMAELQGL